MKIQRAVYEIEALPLSGDWAHQVACEKFGAELVDSFPKVSCGRHVGKPRGYLCYIKATVGGWANNLPSGRGVVFPGTSDWKLAMVTQDDDPRGHSVVARWTWSKDGAYFGDRDRPVRQRDHRDWHS